MNKQGQTYDWTEYKTCIDSQLKSLKYTEVRKVKDLETDT